MNPTRLLRVQFAVKIVGALAVIAYCITGGFQQFRERWYIALLLLALATAAEMFPFTIDHKGARTEFGLDMMVVVAATLLLQTRVGVLIIAFGSAMGYGLRRELNLSRLEGATDRLICAFVAMFIAHIIGPPSLSIQSIAGAIVAALIFDPMSLFFHTLWSVLARGVRFWTFFWGWIAATATTWPWLICLGILLGTLGWDAPWALPLMVAPLALVFMASRSRVDATEDRTRLDGLLRATTVILAATTVADVIDAAKNSATTLFDHQEARLDTRAPLANEIGVLVASAVLADHYLVVAADDVLLPRYADQDRRLLETLASVTASALDKAALHEDVTEQATRDALTGLANRRTFENELRSSGIGKRSTDASGVMFLDLDGFKKINDEHGHKAGDEVLVETAKRLLDSVRAGDTVARLGGDEFTVLLRGVQNRDEAVIVAERILAAMRQPMQLSTGVEVHPTPSLGIALAAEVGTDPNSLLKDADAAMYEAKRAGKDCWRLAHGEVEAAISP